MDNAQRYMAVRKSAVAMGLFLLCPPRIDKLRQALAYFMSAGVPLWVIGRARR